jgi:hypothetical protein
MQNKLIGFLVVALLAAIMIPVAITQLGEGRQPSIVDTHTAVENVSTPEVIQLENFPVVTDSESITVNATPIAKPAEYTIVDATGVVTIAAASSDVGDTIITNYNWQQLTGSIDTIWVLLPILMIVGVLFVFLRRSGLIGGKGAGG